MITRSPSFSRAFRLLFFSLPLLIGFEGVAEVICNFRDQTEIHESSSPNAFPGRAGEGWDGPWKVRRYLSDDSPNKRQQGSLEGISLSEPADASAPRLLQVRGGEPFENDGVGLHRAYRDFGVLDISKPYQISFMVRIDKLPSPPSTELLSHYLFIGENSTGSVGPTSGTTWFLQAFYGADAGKSVTPRNPEHRLGQARQRQWSLGAFVANGDNNDYVPTDVPLIEGAIYTISVVINPEASSYKVSIKGEGASYTSRELPFRKGRPLGKSFVIGSRHSPGNVGAFSVGEIRISPSSLVVQP